MGLGCYTDDGQMLLALAASLVNQHGHCLASDAATQYALAFDPQRGYGGGASKTLALLQSQLGRGPLPPTMGSELLGEHGGSFGNGGAMRIAPLGLAYRNAPVEVLQAAVREALVPTHHLHPCALEGALCQALAVAEACKMPRPGQHGGSAAARGGAAAAPAAAAAAAPAGPVPPSSGSSSSGPPEALQLLRTLQGKLQGHSDLMSGRVGMMAQALQQLHAAAGGPKQADQGWEAFFASPAWACELATAAAIAPGEPDNAGFQIKGTDAAAAALWACMAHWAHPRDAVVAAVHYGGDTDTIACMAGALAGALHGSSWLPQDAWVSQLEQDAGGSASQSFDMPAVRRALQQPECAAEGVSPPGQQQPEAPAGEGMLVRTTRNMGRSGAVTLAQLLARLDVRG